MDWNEILLMNLSSSTPFTLYVTDLHGYLRWVNHTWERLMGIPCGQAIGKHLTEVFPQPFAEEYVRNNQQVAAARMSQVVVEQAMRDDTLRTFQSMKFPLFDENGTVVAVAGVSIDITQQRKIEDEHQRVVEQQARLEGVLLTARQLMHSLNNQLTMPVGTLELLTEEPYLPSDTRTMVQQSLTDISAAVLDIERLQQVVRVITTETPVGPAIDLDQSTRWP